MNRIAFRPLACLGLLAPAALASFVPDRAVAQAPAGPSRFDIPAGQLADALILYAQQADVQLLYSPELARGLLVRRLRGSFRQETALRRLLENSGIRIRRAAPRVFVLDRPTDRTDRLGLEGGQQHDRTDGAESGPAGSPTVADERGEQMPVASDRDIIVTGSHIRGGSAVGSPRRTVGAAEMDRNGQGTVAQALAALPFNFGGMATEQSALAFTDGAGGNASLATGVNLRGLGADATLVLVNGRRIAGSGSMGDFGDISNIPAGAVERIEILLDGASAIYGADAVGGVVNVILKDDLDGMESRLRGGTVTRGGMHNVHVSHTMGKAWSTGNALLSYDYERRSALASDSRRYARSADSRPLGGSDHRLFLGLPGNVLGFDPSTGAFGPAFGIPSDQDGRALDPSDFLRSTTNLENFRQGTDLIPYQRRHSAYATMSQNVGDNIRLWGEGRYSHRRFRSTTLAASTILTIGDANPWFVSPTGAPLDLIAYGFRTELGGTRQAGHAVTMMAAGGLDVDVGRWRISGFAAFAQQRDRNTSSNTLNLRNLDEALGNIADDPATSFSTAAEGFFNPYGNGRSNAPAILSFVGSGYTSSLNRSRITTYHAQADGPFATLPGGAARLAAGIDIRRDSFVRSGEDYIMSATPLPLSRIQFGRSIRAAFGELQVPLVGPGNAMPGLRSLDLSAAVRIEDYASFGTTTNPKFGARWMPAPGIGLNASYGTSFRAPNLREILDPTRLSTGILENAQGISTATIQLTGGNPDLEPETATTWSAGIDLGPEFVPGVTISTSVFRTRFKNRIGQPIFDDRPNALINPAFAPFVRFLSPATSAADRAEIEALLNDPSLGGGSAFPPEAIGAIVDLRYVNTGALEVSGVDLSAGYNFTAGANQFDIGANLSYLFRYRQALTPTSPSIDQLDLAGRPVDWRGRFTAGWRRGAFDALVGVNHVDRYHDLTGRRIGSWTTADIHLGFSPEFGGAARNITVALNVQNMFDSDPPFFDSRVGAGYDAANADATGRFISFQISKRW
ncbi:outer membrane receptor protein involved in Fe transport [Sphingomonas zeicaulis]|uniref:TonB-dependent receptor n=1 Tax=Sphingomonas zeicaulis TaxID=1632740 RepID=UPI003D24CA4D